MFFLKRKSDTFETFLNYQREVEQSLGFQILSFWLDGGGEFTSAEFTEHFKKEGTYARNLPKQAPPQQNGVIERQNRSLLDMARCFTANRNLPSHTALGWGHLYCGLSLKSVSKQSNTECHTWGALHYNQARHLTLAHSRMQCFRLPLQQTKYKLQIGSIHCIFVGYDRTSKTYHCLNHVTKRKFISLKMYDSMRNLKLISEIWGCLLRYMIYRSSSCYLSAQTQ